MELYSRENSTEELSPGDSKKLVPNKDPTDRSRSSLVHRSLSRESLCDNVASTIIKEDGQDQRLFRMLRNLIMVLQNRNLQEPDRGLAKSMLSDLRLITRYSHIEGCISSSDSSLSDAQQYPDCLSTFTKTSASALEWAQHLRCLDNISKLMSFSQKLGFTQAEVRDVLARLGPTAEKDAVLSELLTLTSQQLFPKYVASEHIFISDKVVAPEAGEAKVLRDIVIDGCNVAMTHGNGVFSCQGIQHAVDWFQRRGHTKITVFVPDHRLNNPYFNVTDQYLLKELRNRRILVPTPSRYDSQGKRISSYDDRFILTLATEDEAIVVSNDSYRDLLGVSDGYRVTITQRVLMYTFAGDRFMPAEDPQGRRGLTLDQLLRVHPFEVRDGLCPYGRKCTYRSKCKYKHLERDNYEWSTSQTGTPVRHRFLNYLDSYVGNAEQEMAIGRGFSSRRHSSLSRLQHTPSEGLHAAEEQHVFLHDLSIKQSCAVFTTGASLHPTASNSRRRPSYLVARAFCPAPLEAESKNNLSYDQSQSKCTTKHMSPPCGLQESTTAVNLVSESIDLSLTENDLSLDCMKIGRHSSIDSDDSKVHHLVNRSSPTTYVTRNQNILPPIGRHYNDQLKTPISTSDPRYQIYFHLKSLFPESKVRKALNEMPAEMDPNKICLHLLSC